MRFATAAALCVALPTLALGQPSTDPRYDPIPGFCQAHANVCSLARNRAGQCTLIAGQAQAARSDYLAFRRNKGKGGAIEILNMNGKGEWAEAVASLPDYVTAQHFAIAIRNACLDDVISDLSR